MPAQVAVAAVVVHHSASSADDDDDSVNGALDLFMCARRSWAITIGAPSFSALLRCEASRHARAQMVPSMAECRVIEFQSGFIADNLYLLSCLFTST